MRILLVEDELQLAEALEEMLKKHNYSVDLVHDGEMGLDYLLSDIYDAVILDIMLPKKDGLSILKECRNQGITTPIILLTAKSQISDKVLGLDYGADDYLTKPFSTEELLARLRVLFRGKGVTTQDNLLCLGDIALNLSTWELLVGKESMKLTLKEGQFLELLLRNPQQITSKDRLIDKLWGLDADVEHNNVEVYASFLRRKLKALNSTVEIKALRGLGYMLSIGGEESCSAN